ncbi:hypothetical protein C8T65DRAFT_726919 [Cerioporus squamosus]|nr:hypothetical protein C8T65DRAFT_726919 [Cerioporus squamosus]
MLNIWISLGLLFLAAVQADAQQSFFPAAIPLAAIIGWAGAIRVDGVTYSWMGDNGAEWNNTATVVNIQITPTRSIFDMQAGPMNITVTYLSPIEPSDLINQSIPFSYVSIEAKSLDGAVHDVQIYSDITSEFVTGIRPNGNQGGDPSPDLTWAIDTAGNCRHGFANLGNLTKTQQTTFGPMGQPWYVFAMAVDLGNIQSTTSPVTWAVGYVRDPVVPYTTPSGATEVRRPYWTTRFSDIMALIDAFLADYSAAHDRAIQLDERIMGDAAKISPQYVDPVSLVTRQVMGALDITVLGGSGNNGDATDVKAFMKDIGSTQTWVNPVESMFAAFPTYLYLNASLGAALLTPLLESQDSLSGQPYAAQDIGSSYPNATGTRGAHQQGIEQSGNMLIIMCAHARVSGDGSLLSQHYGTAKRWADYLVNTTLTPINQNSADGMTNPNMTNLAIKGIIGVKAMAEISRATQHDSDAQMYDTSGVSEGTLGSHAQALVSSWLSLAQSSDQQHLLGQYGEESSSAMLYNIYADLLLGTNLIPEDVLSKQTQYYNTLLQTEASPFGLYIDKALGNVASTAWTLFTAATATDDGVRNQLIQYVWGRAASNKTAGELPDVYEDITGASASNGGGAGPALGAVFVPLSLSVQNTTIVVPPRSAGGVVGGVILLVTALGAGFFFWGRRRHQRGPTSEYHYKDELSDHPQPYPYRIDIADQQEPTPNLLYADADARRVEVGPTGDPATPLPVVGGIKARERARELERRSLLSPSGTREELATPPASSNTVMPSHGTETSSNETGPGTVSTTDLLGLRAEVENLRRVVHDIREERLRPSASIRDLVAGRCSCQWFTFEHVPVFISEAYYYP